MGVAQQIEKFIVDEIMIAGRETKLDYDESLLEKGILDSLSLLRLITFIEEQFGVVIADEELIPDNFQTINLTAELVEGKR